MHSRPGLHVAHGVAGWTPLLPPLLSTTLEGPRDGSTLYPVRLGQCPGDPLPVTLKTLCRDTGQLTGPETEAIGNDISFLFEICGGLVAVDAPPVTLQCQEAGEVSWGLEAPG